MDAYATAPLLLAMGQKSLAQAKMESPSSPRTKGIGSLMSTLVCASPAPSKMRMKTCWHKTSNVCLALRTLLASCGCA
eukprot:11156247-Lingulodinium_polyedra.AAC.1